MSVPFDGVVGWVAEKMPLVPMTKVLREALSAHNLKHVLTKALESLRDSSRISAPHFTTFEGVDALPKAFLLSISSDMIVLTMRAPTTERTISNVKARIAFNQKIKDFFTTTCRTAVHEWIERTKLSDRDHQLSRAPHVQPREFTSRRLRRGLNAAVQIKTLAAPDLTKYPVPRP